MGGRGSKKLTTRVLPLAPNQKNKGINFPGVRQAKAIDQAHINSEFNKKVAADAAWANNLSAGQKTALYRYQGSGYKAMNKSLREKFKGNSYSINAETATNIKNMEAALNKASLPEAVVVYRGVLTHTMTLSEAQAMVGTKQVDPAFASTSLSSNLAHGWSGLSHHADGTAAKPYISYRINVPAGAKAAYIQAATNGGLAGEYELTIQRNSLYDITGVSQRVVNGKHYLYINANYAGTNSGKKTK